MGYADFYKLGQHNFYCQICHDKVKVPDTKIRQDFRGLWVCPDCYDIRNPQETPKYKHKKPRKIFPINENDFQIVGQIQHVFGEVGIPDIGDSLAEVGLEYLGKPWKEI